MAKDLNQCNFIGRIGQNLDIKTMPNGNSVVNFSIACSDDYKDKSGTKVEQTNWINVVMFGKAADILGQYCSKGSRIRIAGKQVTRKWQDNDGNDRYTTEIVANDMQFLDSRNDSGSSNSGQSQQNARQNNGASQGQQRPAQQQQTAGGFDDFEDQDIPF